MGRAAAGMIIKRPNTGTASRAHHDAAVPHLDHDAGNGLLPSKKSGGKDGRKIERKKRMSGVAPPPPSFARRASDGQFWW